MIVACPTCRARFRLEDRAAAKPGDRFRCSRCRTVFRASPVAPSGDGVPGLEELTGNFQSALNRVLASTAALLDALENAAEAPPAPAESGGGDNGGALPDMVEKLETLLARNDLEAEEYFREVKGQFAACGFAAQAAELEKLINGFEFKSALTILAEMSGKETSA